MYFALDLKVLLGTSAKKSIEPTTLNLLTKNRNVSFILLVAASVEIVQSMLTELRYFASKMPFELNQQHRIG